MPAHETDPSNDVGFFALFSQTSENLISCARVLVELFADYQNVEEKIRKSAASSIAGDDMTHGIMTKLNQTFITPFDREDIHRLASSLDDVLDFIYAAGARLVMYKITQPPPAAARLAGSSCCRARNWSKAVSLLEKNEHVLQHCVEINRLENEADQVSARPLPSLFENEKDPIELIKMKELIEVLENATDKAEDAANVLEAWC